MVVSKHRKLLLERKRSRDVESQSSEHAPAESRFIRFYHEQYKLLLAFSILLLIASLAVIGWTVHTTGDVFRKGVSLSGGITVTVPTSQTPIPVETIEAALFSALPDADISVREITEFGAQRAIIAEIATDRTRSIEEFEQISLDAVGSVTPTDGASVEVVGSALGESFFEQVVRSVLVAFILMGLVVFLYFGERLRDKVLVSALSVIAVFLTWNASGAIGIAFACVVGAALIAAYLRYSVPSAAVIFAAASTITFTIAVVDLLGMRVSTAGIAAFLMLVGYSVDTDILLSTRVLKRSDGTLNDRIWSTVITGLTMECTTIAASSIGLIFTQSAVIREIMTIILIGLVADIIFTWIQNVGILRMYLARRRA